MDGPAYWSLFDWLIFIIAVPALTIPAALGGWKFGKKYSNYSRNNNG